MQRPITSIRRVISFVSLVGIVLASVASPALSQKPGTHERTLKSGGTEREYLLHIPRGYKKNQKKPVPLVVMLHGRTSNGRAAASRYYGWKDLADEEKFVAVFPTALGTPTSWKGAWRGKPTEDTTFLAELIDLLLKELRIDEHRVFMTGHSSGGFMSYSFATTHSEKVAAIGPVAGLTGRLGKPKVPVSVISFHGMKDRVVPYGKEQRWGMRTATESTEAFAQANGCAECKRTGLADGKVHRDTWPKGKNGTEVVLYSIVEGDHAWPRRRSHAVSATPRIWEFFKTHPRPAQKQKKAR